MKLQFDIDFYGQMWTSNTSPATRLSLQNKECLLKIMLI